LAVALGVQDKFSWGAVAAGALGAGIASGIGGLTSAAGGIGGQLLGKGTLGAQIVNGAAQNAISQGVNLLTGVQKKFDWRGLAAAAVSAPIAGAISQNLNSAGFAGAVLGRTASGIVTAVTQAAFHGGKANFANIAADAFGNTLGWAIVDQAQLGWQQSQRLLNARAEATPEDQRLAMMDTNQERVTDRGRAAQAELEADRRLRVQRNLEDDEAFDRESQGLPANPPGSQRVPPIQVTPEDRIENWPFSRPSPRQSNDGSSSEMDSNLDRLAEANIGRDAAGDAPPAWALASASKPEGYYDGRLHITVTRGAPGLPSDLTGTWADPFLVTASPSWADVDARRTASEATADTATPSADADSARTESGIATNSDSVRVWARHIYSRPYPDTVHLPDIPELQGLSFFAMKQLFGEQEERDLTDRAGREPLRATCLRCRCSVHRANKAFHPEPR
jgi:hypothetical protein